MNNLEELKQELKKLENKINELENKETEEVNKYKRKRCDEYFYLDSSGELDTEDDYHDSTDNFRYSIGNYFETEEQVENYKEKLKIEQKLKDIARELNNDEEIDWSEGRQSKYGLYFDYSSNGIFQLISIVSKHQGTIYCLDKNFKDVAINRIGEERLTKYLKGELD